MKKILRALLMVLLIMTIMFISTECTVKKGDIDANDEIDIIDYTRLKLHLYCAEKEMLLNPIERWRADIDKNGAVNLVDYDLLRILVQEGMLEEMTND